MNTKTVFLTLGEKNVLQKIGIKYIKSQNIKRNIKVLQEALEAFYFLLHTY